MMYPYEVTYDITTSPKDSYSGGYSTRSDMSNLTIVVQAMGPSQARSIVESMFGGPSACVTKNAVLIG